MIINIITPFPDMFKVIINESIMLKSHQKGVVKYNVFNLFDPNSYTRRESRVILNCMKNLINSI